MKKLLTLVLLSATIIFSQRANAAVGCDTISNLTTNDTLTIYYSPYGGGYLSGNNSSGDLQKAEQFNGPIGSQVTGAFLGFGYVTINTSDSSTPVTINVYDASAGAPNGVITTATVTLAQIAAAINAQTELYVSFAAAPTLTANAFFISVQLPTNGGDTVVLLTNQQDGQDGNGWEQWNDNSWHAYNSPFLYYFPNDLGNDIQAVTCGGGPLAAFQSTLLNNCANSATIDFYNTSTNGTNSISWSFPGGTPSTSTAADPVVTYSSTGIYNFQLVAYGTSVNDTLNSTVNIYPAVTASVSSTPASGAGVNDGTATVTGLTGTSPYYYYWDATGDTTSTETGLTPGTYYVNVTDNDGCYVNDSVVVRVSTGLISIGGNVSAKIYPSPASDVLNIIWSAATTAGLSITDMSGKVVSQYNVSNSLSNTLDIRSLSPGAYILSIRDMAGHAGQSVRFVKL